MRKQTFVEMIESTYGRYREGMASTIIDHIRGADSQGLQQLYDAVVSEHERATPPPLAVIKRIASNKMIQLSSCKAEYMSVCMECERDFSLDMYDCPHCGLGDLTDPAKRGTGKSPRKRGVRRVA